MIVVGMISRMQAHTDYSVSTLLARLSTTYTHTHKYIAVFKRYGASRNINIGFTTQYQGTVIFRLHREF